MGGHSAQPPDASYSTTWPDLRRHVVGREIRDWNKKISEAASRYNRPEAEQG
jgi:hypothetical protein